MKKLSRKGISVLLACAVLLSSLVIMLPTAAVGAASTDDDYAGVIMKVVDTYGNSVDYMEVSSSDTSATFSNAYFVQITNQTKSTVVISNLSAYNTTSGNCYLYVSGGQAVTSGTIDPGDSMKFRLSPNLTSAASVYYGLIYLSYYIDGFNDIDGIYRELTATCSFAMQYLPDSNQKMTYEVDFDPARCEVWYDGTYFVSSKNAKFVLTDTSGMTTAEHSVTGNLYIDREQNQTWQSLGFGWQLVQKYSNRIRFETPPTQVFSGEYDTYGGSIAWPESIGNNYAIVSATKGDSKSFSYSGEIPLGSKTSPDPRTLVFTLPTQGVYVFTALTTGTINLNIYSYDKTDLRELVYACENTVFNSALYETANVSNYEEALKTARLVLGRVDTSNYDVEAARSALQSAYNLLVQSKKSIVEVNHNYIASSANNVETVLTTHHILTSVGSFAPTIFNKTEFQGRFGRSYDTYYSVISDDGATFNIVYLVQNKDALQAAIDTAPTNPNLYTAETWAVFTARLAEANTVNENDRATQSEIDTATNNLTAAIAGLQRLVFEDDDFIAARDWLAELITAEDYFDNMAASDFRTLRSLYDDEMKDFMDNAESQAQIDTATQKIWDTIYPLIRTGTANYKTQLRALLLTAEDYDEAEYTAESFAVLRDAIAKGYKYLNNIFVFADAAELQDVIDELQKAIDDLVPDVNYEAFEEAVHTAKAFSADPYFTGSAVWDDFSEQLSALEEQLEQAKNGKLLQLAINEYTQDTLELIEKMNALTDLMELRDARANEIDAEKHTQKSITELEMAITEAETLLNGSVPAAEDSERAADTLRAVQLVEKPVLTVADASDAEIDDAYLCGIDAGTTIEDAMDQLVLSGEGTMKIVDSEGNEIAADAVIATGYQLIVTAADGDIVETLDLVVLGDVLGDGQVTQADAEAIRKHLTGNTLTGVYLRAADLNGDGKVDVADLAKIYQMVK